MSPTAHTDAVVFQIKEYLDERFAIQDRHMDERFASLEKRLDKINGSIGRHDDCIAALQQGQVERKTQIDNLKSDVEKLEKKSDTWSVINSLFAAVAAFLGLGGIAK